MRKWGFVLSQTLCLSDFLWSWTLAWLGICIMWCNVLAHIQNSLHVCVTCTLVELFLMCLGHEFVYRRWPLDCVAAGIRLLHVHPKLFLACPEVTAGALKSVCAQHGHTLLDLQVLILL